MSPHAPLSHNHPGQAGNHHAMVQIVPAAAAVPCLVPWGALSAPGEENRSTHSRAWLHGGGSREGCQHVATLQREAKPNEFGHASPSHSCLHWLWSHHIPVRCGLLGAVVEMGPWEAYGREQGACVWAQSFGAAGGEKDGEESRVQSRPWQGPFGVEGLPLEPV